MENKGEKLSFSPLYLFNETNRKKQNMKSKDFVSTIYYYKILFPNILTLLAQNEKERTITNPCRYSHL